MEGRRALLMLWAAAGVLLVVGFTGREPRAPGFTPPPRAPGLLRVVTWNVGGSGAHGGHPFDDRQVGHVARTLRSLDADLVFLQEIRSAAQWRRLRTALGPAWEGRLGRAHQGSHVGVLAQRGTLEPLAWRPVRHAVGVVYRAQRFGEVAAIGVHADAFSARRRNRRIGRAADALRGRAAGACILAGDLNLDLDLDKRRDLFTDDEHLDVETYNYALRGFTDAGVGRGATAEPDRRLDYILVQTRRWQVRDAGPWKGRRRGDMDHDPLVADLEIRP